MASGGSDRQTGTVPKTKARNNCNVPQEVVTPTRRDMNSTNIMTTCMDWLPVSEHNTRSSQNKSRKPTNIPTDHDFAELDSSTPHESGSRFVPVRPQPRTLVLRQRDNLLDSADDNASYGAILGGHSPHTSHAAIMIVNPTTPNSNQSHQNMNSTGSGSRNNTRGGSVGREGYSNNTAPVCPHPVSNNNPKPTNISHDPHDSIYQNGTSHNYSSENIVQNQQADHMLPRTEVARTIGDNMVAACPDSARVEHRLGQIREYIRVTSTLVDSMRNSEDEEALHRPASAQSSVSAYSDNEIWRNELKANMEISKLRLAAAYQEQKRLLNYQAEAKEQLAEMNLARNGHMEHAGGSSGDMQDSAPPPSSHPVYHGAGRVYGSNQIGVATTLPHMTEGSQHNNNYNWNNQGARKRASSSREREPLSTVREPPGAAIAAIPSDQAEIDMLRDLQMRRHHLESQVAKIQNLHAATSSLADAVSCPPSVEAGGAWGGSEGAASEDEGGSVEATIRNKVAAVNVMKVELERLKSMLRTVDSIQNNFRMNSTFEDENIFENTHPPLQQENQNRNRNRVSESSVNNVPLCRTDSNSSSKLMKDGQAASQNSGANSKNQNTPLGLSRLQNCISSGSNKCTNVSEQNHHPAGDSMGSGLAAIQQLTHELKQAAQGLTEERRRLKHAVTNRDICTSSGSSIKSEDKKRTNSTSGHTAVGYPPRNGPVERRQLALKAELEAKKRQLERLMSKDVDHRTNQQSLALDLSAASKPTPSGADDASLPLPSAAIQPAVAVEDDCACSALTTRTDIDNGYSSDQDDDEAYLSPSRNQLNINRMSGGPPHKLPSRGSSIDNFKDTCYLGDSTQSLDGSYASQGVAKGGPAGGSCTAGKLHNRPPPPPSAATPPPAPGPFLSLPVSNDAPPSGRNKQDVCDVSNVSNASSETSSEGDRDPVPPPMASLPPRHHRQLGKNNHDSNSNPDTTPPQWHNPHSESQMTMWWHNKANQLQHQLEMTNNFCQSLMQDKRTGQMTPSTLNSSSQTTQAPSSILLPNYQNNAMAFPIHGNNPAMFPNYGNPYQGYPTNPMMMPSQNMGAMMFPGMEMMMGSQLWAVQQQQAATAWGSAHCVHHLLSQQREISSLRSTVSNLEERLQTMNLNMPRAHSTPPHHFQENTPAQLGARANSAQSQYWNIQSQANLAASDAPNAQYHPVSHPSQSRVPKAPHIPPFPAEHYNNQLPANFSLPSNVCQSEQINDPAQNNMAVTNQQLFNNCVPAVQLNPNVLSNQSIPQPIQNNRNPNCLLNLTPHVAMSTPHPMGSQTLTGQSPALNNQVPPGNRANNYWDNFRSYSRQNLLSGSSKSNTDPAFSTHGPHPLAERSHNTLHSGTPPCASIAPQAANTPKRNVNSVPEVGVDSAQQRRGRRNLSQETEYFAAPPDVLNVNQNLDSDPNQLLTNLLSGTEESPAVNRFHSSVNVNVNRLDANPIPEIIQAHSNNLNVPRSNGAHKKKSSSKLPAKNSSNAGNYSSDYTHNRNVEANMGNDVFNPNLATASTSNDREKSTTKLFDLLRENVYSEVTALISANESRPHFLIQLFRDLQQISSDNLRQRALQSIQELVTQYLSAVETESYEANDDRRNSRRILISDDNSGAAHNSQSNDAAILSADVDNEIVRFIISHHSEICNEDLLESLQNVVMSKTANQNNHTILDQNLRDSLAKFRGCKLEDISDDLVISITRIISAADMNAYQNEALATESSGEATEAARSMERNNIVSYQENAANDRHFGQHIALENLEMESASSHMEGIACASGMVANQNEAAALYSAPCNSSHDPPKRFANMSESKIDLIESVETYNGDLAEADQSRHGSETIAAPGDGLPDVVDTEEQTPTEAEAEWLGLDRVPTRLQMEDNPGNQSDSSQA